MCVWLCYKCASDWHPGHGRLTSQMRQRWWYVVSPVSSLRHFSTWQVGTVPPSVLPDRDSCRPTRRPRIPEVMRRNQPDHCATCNKASVRPSSRL